MSDNVNHPSHYTAGKVECIDALEAATTGLEGIEAVCTASAIKYLWRWKLKGGAEDLKKARWYIDHLLGAHIAPAAKPMTAAEHLVALGPSRQVNVNHGGPPSQPIPYLRGADPAQCVKCGKTFQTFMLNDEGWCSTCFAAPSRRAALSGEIGDAG
jgi:hypothetical protein